MYPHAYTIITAIMCDTYIYSGQQSFFSQEQENKDEGLVFDSS